MASSMTRPRIRRYGELMRNEGRRLTEMVEQILEFAGIQSGQRGFALRPVGIATLLHDIVAASAGLIEAAGLVVTFEIPTDLPDVLGDEPALRRVFQNLIDNAIKYGAAGGSIRDQRAARSGSAGQRHRRRSWHRHRCRRSVAASSSRSIAPPTSSRRRCRAPVSG